MLRSLRTRLVLTHLLVGGLVLLLLALSFIAIQVSNPAADRFVFERLDLISRVAASQNRLRAGLLADAPLERTLAVLGRGIDASAVLLSAEGQTLGSGASDHPALPQPVVAQLVTAGETSRGRFVTAGGAWLYLGRRLASGQWLVLLAPRPSARTILGQLTEIIDPLWQAGLVALLSSLLLALLLARWVARPLNQLTDAAGEVAAGHFDLEVVPSGPKEIRGLAAAFNHMIERVKTSQKSQRDFIANISHELKTPLTSIAGFAQAILDGAASSEAQRSQAAQVIYQESQRLQRMVDQLLSLAKFDAGQVQLVLSPVEVEELISSCIERMKPAAQAKAIEITLSVTGAPSIQADADRVGQVLINLLDNAIKNSRENGRVRVHAGQLEDWVTISVEDGGVGLDASQLSRIFERFYQTDRARSAGDEAGVGLGLAISYEIVRAHGGQMTAESKPDQGSTFSFSLPVEPSLASTLARQRQ
jgi:signal transduction histidine kinase